MTPLTKLLLYPFAHPIETAKFVRDVWRSFTAPGSIPPKGPEPRYTPPIQPKGDVQ